MTMLRMYNSFGKKAMIFLALSFIDILKWVIGWKVAYYSCRCCLFGPSQLSKEDNVNV